MRQHACPPDHAPADHALPPARTTVPVAASQPATPSVRLTSLDQTPLDRVAQLMPARTRGEEDGEESDVLLMARIRDGDQAAYRQLVNRHLKRGFGLARRLCGSEAEAEDIVQDVFLQIWLRRTQWTDEGARFTTWLYRVIVNRCIDHKRRPVGEELEAVPEPLDHGPDAVSTIHRAQVAARLKDAQAKLPPQQQAALTLFYYEGLSNADIASVMQISITAVESLLKRARQQLRTLLKASAQAARDAFDDG